MIRGLYTSASGMNAEMTRQDVVANNLANAGTVGFKKDKAVFAAFPDRLLSRINDRLRGGEQRPFMRDEEAQPIGMVGHGTALVGVQTHFADGNATRTDGPLDLALRGDALFTVERGDGSRAYTRAGQFSLDANSQLVTQAGDVVLGQGGRPIVIQGSEVVVDHSGGVQVDGREAGKLLLARWDPTRFEKLGENLYLSKEDALEAVAKDEAVPQGAEVWQGFTEESNVSVIEAMVDMITVMRAYESNQKAIQMQDDTLNQVINQVGRPA